MCTYIIIPSLMECVCMGSQCAFVCMSLIMFAWISACLCTYVCMWACVCVCVFFHVCVCACVYVIACVCYACIHICVCPVNSDLAIDSQCPKELYPRARKELQCKDCNRKGIRCKFLRQLRVTQCC